MEEPLGFRGIGFSPMFALLKPTFSLPLRPHQFSLTLHPQTERSPTDLYFCNKNGVLYAVSLPSRACRNFFRKLSCFTENNASPNFQKYKSHSFGRPLSPVHFRRKNAPPVSYYALFKGWLLLSKPPGCFSILTSFTT